MYVNARKRERERERERFAAAAPLTDYTGDEACRGGTRERSDKRLGKGEKCNNKNLKWSSGNCPREAFFPWLLNSVRAVL